MAVPDTLPARDHRAPCDCSLAAHVALLPRWIIWGAVGTLLLFQVGLLWGGMARSLHGSTDFRAFYATGRLVALHRGKDIYNLGVQTTAQRTWISATDQTLPFLYPAFASLFFVPFGYLPFKYAVVAFAMLNIAILVLISRWVAGQLAVQSSAASWIACSLTFGLVSSVMAVLQGQITCLLLCVLAGTLELSRRKCDTLAGIVLSLSLVKFQLGIPLALLICAWKRWDMVRGFIYGAIVLALLSVGATGLTAAMQYVRMMSGMTQLTAANPLAAKAIYGMFPSDMPNIHGTAYVLTMGRPTSFVITAVVSGLLLIWASRRDRGLPVAICVAMLVSYHFQAYDMALLLIPLTASLSEMLLECNDSVTGPGANGRREARKRLGLLFVACGLLVAPVGAAIVYNRRSWIFSVATAAVLMSLPWKSNVAQSRCNR